MQEQTTEYPIDTRVLQKGDRVEVATIERAFGVSRDTKDYRLALMRVRAHVELRFADRGEPVTIAESDGDLMILTDAEAATYNDARVWGYVRRAAMALKRQRDVDRSKLDDDQRKRHDRALETNGRAIMAATRERALPAPKPNQRQTPARLPTSKETPCS